MNEFDINDYREAKIIPTIIKQKRQYFLDLDNIILGSTGRADVLFANIFLQECHQLLINSISVFEKGFFDCAFYSLRQALELATTIVYFTDDEEKNREKEVIKWKNQDRFPMTKEMITELQKRKKVYADIKIKMFSFFEEKEDTKKKLNKYVHKQGFDKFYITPINLILSKENKIEKIQKEFIKLLDETIGAIAVLRLCIDPCPILLMDKEIYNRPFDVFTEPYSDLFVEKYIGKEHIENYKKTELYLEVYNQIMSCEKMLPSVVDVFKNGFVDRAYFNEISSQFDLLNHYKQNAVALFIFSEKIANIYYLDGLVWCYSNIKSNKINGNFNSNDLVRIKNDKYNFNCNYYEVFLSYMNIKGDDYYIEHNEVFSKEEIEILLTGFC